jgi:septal ring factor EnvC (AmiA/AmiB activator)
MTPEMEILARLRRTLQDERTANSRLLAQLAALQDENKELRGKLAAGKATIKRLANIATAAGLISGDKLE